VYKLVWPEMIAYCILYAIMSIVYRLALNEEQRTVFEKVTLECDYYSQLIPVAFVLGFYVTLVVSRWWDQYNNTPWPDSLCILLSTAIEGHDKQSRLMRRTIARYINLTTTMTFVMISSQAKKRFPTTEHLIEAGLLEENELMIFRKMDDKSEHPKYWMPLVWAGTIVKRARREGRLKDDYAMRALLDEINKIRGQCGSLLGYDWINVPLVYTQVVTLAVYTFFLATIMGRQFLDPSKTYQTSSYHGLDYYVPIFTVLQFFFYMGWLKVAESLLNPFGEDDDDFETNFLIDRNLQVSYLIVDEMHEEHPKLIQDKFWDECVPSQLPYTKAAEDFIIDVPMGSTAEIVVPAQKREILSTTTELPEDAEFAIGRTKTFRGLVSTVLKKNSGEIAQHRRTIRRSNNKKTYEKAKEVQIAAIIAAQKPKVEAAKPVNNATAPKAIPKKETVVDMEKAKLDPSTKAAVDGSDIPTIDGEPIQVAGSPPKKKMLVKEPSQESIGEYEREEEAEREESAW